MKNFRKILPKDENLIISLYKEKGIEKISKLLNYSRNKIRKLLINNNISIKTHKEINKKYSVYENYFEIIDSKDKAYFLGFLIADGNIFKNKIRISLQEEDGYILEKFKDYIKYDGIVHTILKGNNKKRQKCLVITSTKISNDLINIGCIQNKSHFTFFPNIPKEFYSHFIRGVFDGDGCITTIKPKNRPSKTNTFSIIGNNLLIEKIQEILMENCNLNKTSLYSPKNTSNNIVYLIYGGNKNCIKIKNYLYNDC